MNKTGEEVAGSIKKAKVETNAPRDTGFMQETFQCALGFPSALPEEILENIFLNIEDSKDVQAIANSCPQFRRIVKPFLTEWMFDQIFPLIFARLDNKEILACRQVCKKWNRSVDQFLQMHPHHSRKIPYPYHPSRINAADNHIVNRSRPDHRPHCYPALCSKVLYGRIFYSVGKIQEFSEKMEGGLPTNPFVTRATEFINIQDDEETYWNHALSFLERFGEHVWHVCLAPIFPCPVVNYRIFRDALLLMPNVRTLAVCGFEGSHRYGGTRMRSFIQRHPLPRLPHLHTIEELLPASQVGRLVLAEMLEKYSAQSISLLTCVRGREPPAWNTMTQMTALRLGIYGDTLKFWSQLARSSPAPSLAKLSLAVCTYRTVSISKLLEPVQKVFPSLVYLHIWVGPQARIHNCSRAPKFLMESVKTLEVNDHPSLQFNRILSFFPKLEYVLVCHKLDAPIHCDVEDEKEMEIRMLMRNCSMYRSDVWTRIQTLREFTIARYGDEGDGDERVVERQFTRQGYECYVGDKL